MIRSTVRRKGLPAAILPILLSAGFLALACETPTPPAASEPEPTLEAFEVPAMESSPVPIEVSEGDDGYFLVRKGAGKVEYVGPVSEGQLRLIKEDESGVAFRVGQISLPDESSAPEAGQYEKTKQFEVQQGGVIRFRETGAEDGPKPLIVVDGVIVSDPDFMETLNKEDIESIEVIKGAAAAELYGERAAGGVIKIFTKH